MRYDVHKWCHPSSTSTSQPNHHHPTTTYQLLVVQTLFIACLNLLCKLLCCCWVVLNLERTLVGLLTVRDPPGVTVVVFWCVADPSTTTTNINHHHSSHTCSLGDRSLGCACVSLRLYVHSPACPLWVERRTPCHQHGHQAAWKGPFQSCCGRHHLHPRCLLVHLVGEEGVRMGGMVVHLVRML